MITFVIYILLLKINDSYMNLKTLSFVSALVVLLASCAAPTNISYFQDADSRGMSVPVTENHIRLRPEDKISIIVNTSNDQLTNLFNLPYISQRLGGVSQSVASNYSQAVSGYTVDENGDIDFPVMGKLHIEGLTRPEVAALIKGELTSRSLAKDPVVTVEFMNLTIAVMGEVARPGRYAIEKDKKQSVSRRQSGLRSRERSGCDGYREHDAVPRSLSRTWRRYQSDGWHRSERFAD